MNSPVTIFNRTHVQQHRNRAAQSRDADFLLQEMVARTVEQCAELGKNFDLALDVGAHHGLLAKGLKEQGVVGDVIQTDLSQALLKQADGLRVTMDEEWVCFAPETFDLVVSCGSLHWVNDVPGALVQLQKLLKPGGVFIAMMPGGHTLHELRDAFEAAEMQHYSGVSPHVSPFIDVRDAGSLLQRAGFIEPVTSSDLLAVSYERVGKLLYDLQKMGQGNALIERRKAFTNPSMFAALSDIYKQRYSDAEGRIIASFELVTMTAWKA